MTGRFRRFRPRLFAPLRHRDFALLSLGETVSLLGDGFFAVALPFQVYQLSNSPSAYSLVSAIQFVPLVLLLLVGGLVSDRIDRRRILFSSDILRAAITGLIGLLAVSGRLRIWHMLLLLPCFGAGTAFFQPASTAILPDLVPDRDLPQANAFRGAVRPLMLALLGPASAGFVVGAAGPGPAMLVDAASFLISATAVILTKPRPRTRSRSGADAPASEELRAGWRFVRGHTWCWAVLCGTALALLCRTGPTLVLLPYIVKNNLHAGATGLGVIFAAGGVGSIVMSVLVGQLGMPRRPVAVIFASGIVAITLTAGYGAMTAVWQGMLIALVINGFSSSSAFIWDTLLQREVPRELLGRVSSIDWFIFTALLPLSLAVAGPIAALAGARQTLVAGGLLGAIAFGAFSLVPGVGALQHKAAQ
ncbi:MAG: MFS transporter [Dehalococcoidia bacterium]